MKRPKTNTYIVKIMHRHILFIIALIVFIVLGAVIIPFQLKRYTALKNELDRANEEVVQMHTRMKVIQKYSSINVGEILAIYNILYPNNEDRFSIYKAMDAMGLQSGLFITDFSSPFTKGSLEEIDITVQARGEKTVIESFLKNYHTISGRLITMKNLSVDFTKNSISFTATFYSKEVDADINSLPKYDENAITYAREVQENMPVTQSASFKEDHLEKISTDYAVKEDPFK